eukprot:10103264-Alexandrium_andersonii.AAC.1
MSASLVGSEMCIRDRIGGVVPKRSRPFGDVGLEVPKWLPLRKQSPPEPLCVGSVCVVGRAPWEPADPAH